MEAAASAITIVATAWQLSVSLTKLIQEIKRQDEDVQQLEVKAVSLGAVIQEVENAYKPKDGQVSFLSGGQAEANIRNLVVDATNRCASDLEKFEEELSAMLVKRKGLGGSILRRWRLQVAAPAFARIQKSIEGHQLSLHLLIQLLHGQSLESTRQLMAKGFATLLASNRQMFAMLQNMADVPGVPLNRQDTQATLVPPSENEEQATSAVENEQMLHQFFEGIFAVWLKNMSGEGNQPNTPPMPIPLQPGSPGVPFTNTASGPSLSPNKGSFDAYTFAQARTRRQSSPGVPPKDAEAEGALHPMTFTMSNQSQASRTSHESPPSVFTRSSSQSESSQMSEHSRLAARRARVSRVRRGTNDSKSSNAPRVKIDLSNCEPEDREKGLKLLDHVQNNDIRNIEALIENGATLEEEGKHEKTPLLLATYLGKVDAAHILIQGGADLNATDKNDQTALHLAVRRPSAHAIIPSLITTLNTSTLNPIEEQHPLLNACDKDGRTPLHECAKFGMLEPAKTLLAHGADINARDFAGLPPAYFAMSNRKYELTALFLSRDADFASFQWPPSDKYGDSIEKLLRKNGKQRPDAPPDEEDAGGGSAKKKQQPAPRRSSRSFGIGRRRDSAKS